MNDRTAKDKIETFIGRMKCRMADGGPMLADEIANVVEALYWLLSKKKDK